MSILNRELIQKLRESKGWDQSRLAGSAGIHRSIISRIERGLQDDVRLTIAIAIARALDVQVDTLLGESRGSSQKVLLELEAVIMQLGNLPEKEQRQAAGILRGYLSTLN